MHPNPQVLLITGPAGVGKSTLSWELAAQLRDAGIPHAALDTDELDRVFPVPPDDPQTVALSRRNLSLLWSGYQALGHTRLILVGVMVDLALNLAWITDAVPGAVVTVVRLVARRATLLQRLDVREIGSGRDDQIRRTLSQAARIAGQQHDGVLVLPTDGNPPPQLARLVLRHAGWLRNPDSQTQVPTTDH
jgi:hypothetical protein